MQKIQAGWCHCRSAAVRQVVVQASAKGCSERLETSTMAAQRSGAIVIVFL
jgi:hypothetical protein